MGKGVLVRFQESKPVGSFERILNRTYKGKEKERCKDEPAPYILPTVVNRDRLQKLHQVPASFSLLIDR